MAKLKDPITQSDLTEFVAKDSDFSFEMRVLAQFRQLGFECEHSGTYRDPVTEKIRQFDIRATKDLRNTTFALAVESKNLRPDRPLLISAVPRTDDEAFHDRIIFERTKLWMASIDRSKGIDSAYKPAEMVGKKTDQVAKGASGELISDDQATFDKLNQAVNSCQELVRQLVLSASPPFIRVIAPVLVVPNGLLWQVDYDGGGALLAAPREVPRTTLYLSHGWSVERNVHGPITYFLAHIEVVTIDAIAEWVETRLSPSGFVR